MRGERAEAMSRRLLLRRSRFVIILPRHTAAPRAAKTQPAAAPPTWQLFVPKTITVLRQGYRIGDLRADLVAGLTVAIVALPLAMALAIASGTKPEKGLVTAVVGGFLASLLRGARFNISGPTGAFVVVVFGVIEKYGYDGLIIATLLAAAMQVAARPFCSCTAWPKRFPCRVTGRRSWPTTSTTSPARLMTARFRSTRFLRASKRSSCQGHCSLALLAGSPMP